VKKILLSFCFIVGVKQLIAQQRPYFTQYILNNFLVNPAVAGIDNYTDIKMSHRLQWVGLQDAPVTTYFTVNAPLHKRDYDVDRDNPTTVHPRGVNPMLGLDDYQPPDPHSGIGFTVLNDKTGPLNRFAAYGTYAYHMNISSKTNLSLGISAGINQMSLDASKLNFGNNSNTDPSVATSKSSTLDKINPDVSAGLWIYSRDYFIGLAAQQIIADKLYFSDY
jgi:type IX secretion system PorP/SprF family membrane protein